ncbi:MAG: HEAT repeat domain-containing protein [Endomicrobia bacterium]|nr:HEAT repeat domain-containing protein [Endomicrobiia bacterium]
MAVKFNVLFLVFFCALFLFGCLEKNTHKKASALLKEGKDDAAVAVYENILKKKSDDLVALKAVADIKFKKKDLQGAMEGYQKVIEKDPSQCIAEMVSMFSYNKNIRDMAADKVRGLGNGRTEVINGLIAQMEAGNNYLKIDYMNSLARIGVGASFTAGTISKYLDDEYFGMRKAALETLGTYDANQLKEVGAIEKIVKCLNDDNITVVEAAVKSLGALKSGANETVPDLIEMLEKQNTDVRDAAKQAIADIGPANKSTVPALVALIDSKRPVVIRVAAIDALTAIGNNANNAVADLIPLLQDSNNIVKTAAANALTKIGKASAESVPELLKLLAHKDNYIKTRAIAELSEIGKAASAALVPLEQLSKDAGSSKEVREEAKKAYDKISKARR